MAELDREIAAYQEQEKDLLKHHAGKYVVFYDGAFVGAWDSFNAAAEEAVRKYERGPYLIRQVGASPITLPASVVMRPVQDVHS